MRLNNESNIKVRSGGVGFGGLLALLFIGLKLGGVIGWSWWWVLSPLWIPFALVLAVVALAFAGVLAAHGLVALHEYRQARKNINSDNAVINSVPFSTKSTFDLP